MNNALDVILMSILDMIGIETQETKDVKSGKKAIENTKGNRLSPKDQKFKTGGQTEMFNNRGKLRNFKSPSQSANRQPTTSPIRHTPTQQLNPGPTRPPAPGQGTLGGEVPRGNRFRAPGVPPRMGTPTAAGPQTKPPIRGESYKDLKAKPQPKAPGVKGSTPKPSGPSTPLSKGPNKLTRALGKAPVKSEMGAMAILTALNQLISRFPGQDPEVSRKLNQALVSYWTGNVDEEGRVLDVDGLPIEAGRTPEVAPEAPELPESEGITMPEITPQPMNLSEEARSTYWDQVPMTPVVPPRNPSQAPVSATREQLRPQVNQTMPNMGYETVSPNRGQLAPNPFYGR